MSLTAYIIRINYSPAASRGFFAPKSPVPIDKPPPPCYNTITEKSP